MNTILNSSYSKLEQTPARVTRVCTSSSLDRLTATPESVYVVSLPKLSDDQCIIPESLRLSVKFTNSNTKSWFLNDVGNLLISRLAISMDGKELYNNTGEGLFEVYRNLWLKEEVRECMKEYGIANENTRKLMSKDDSAVTSNKASDVLMSKVYTEIKIPLGKVLKNNGLFAPYSLIGRPVEYSITLPKATMIMEAQQNQVLQDTNLKTCIWSIKQSSL